MPAFIFASLPRARSSKPWGSELWYAHTERYAGKILRVHAGHKLSVQYHSQKDETSYLLSGRLLLEQGEGADTMLRREVSPGESVAKPTEARALD
jgi:mannose-6-phosphate isomerase